jgi:hypothetical protein
VEWPGSTRVRPLRPREPFDARVLREVRSAREASRLALAPPSPGLARVPPPGVGFADLAGPDLAGTPRGAAMGGMPTRRWRRRWRCAARCRVPTPSQGMGTSGHRRLPRGRPTVAISTASSTRLLLYATAPTMTTARARTDGRLRRVGAEDPPRARPLPADSLALTGAKVRRPPLLRAALDRSAIRRRLDLADTALIVVASRYRSIWDTTRRREAFRARPGGGVAARGKALVKPHPAEPGTLTPPTCAWPGPRACAC